ncbi:hypothetical protein N0V95_000578 [Ascochyta clinopodiicola]|nr:hypothetical protein N0V95_000578 [Ascochyta clinopodiicola]
MTGYITTYKPYVEDYNHNLVEWAKVDEIVRSISGADGIGFGNKDVWVTTQDEELLHTVDNFIGEYSNASNTRTGENTMDDEAQGHDMPGKRPNIKIFQVGTGTEWKFENAITTVQHSNVSITTYLSTGKPIRDTTAPDEQYYSITGRYGDQYNSSYIKTHSSCKPSETYQWGFSYIFLFMMSIFNFLWSVIM